VWNKYYNGLKDLPISFPSDKEHNASIFYFNCTSLEQRTELISYLKEQGVPASFHYQALHKSAFMHSSASLPNSEKFSDQLVRLPLYPDLTDVQTDRVISAVRSFFK
jgi:dTDP-4-amino-4,6-dideoxygalactose transaminase